MPMHCRLLQTQNNSSYVPAPKTPRKHLFCICFIGHIAPFLIPSLHPLACRGQAFAAWSMGLRLPCLPHTLANSITQT